MPHRPDEAVAVFSSYYDRKRYDFKVLHRHLSRVPPWPASFPNPPLPVRRAVALATAHLPKLVAEAPRWHFNEVTLREVGEGQKWLYVVSFIGFHPPGIVDGAVPSMGLVILMNGQIIEPDISPQ